jgi:transglutaminase-like putative cysteine protease
MKRLNLLTVILLISLTFLPDINAKTTRRRPIAKPHETTGSRNNVEFNLCEDFSMQAVASKLTFVTLVPKTIPDRQKILSIKYSTPPARVFSSNGNDYAEFVFSRPPTQFQLKINVKATLLKYDLDTAKKKQQKNSPEDSDPNDFLKQEKYIEKDDPRIQQIAKSIKAPTDMTLVQKLYEYVVDNLNYVTHKEEWGAVEALRRKQGSCTEYSDLFVALCRAANIPARVVKGYVTESDDSPEHAWAEACLKNYGWVPFDLTYGDVEQKSAIKKRFSSLKPIYIYLTHTRNDRILDESITVTGYFIGDVQLQSSIEFR